MGLGQKLKQVGASALQSARAVTDGHLASRLQIQLNARTHQTFALPILLYAPTSRCNSRCISCDYWRTDGANDLTRDEVRGICRDLRALGTKLVVFTGGEALVREDVFELAELFRREGVTLHLLTSGLALEKHAAEVARLFDAVTISLDGHTARLYREVRGVDGLAAVERGIARLKALRPDLPLRARSTIHRRNFRALPDLIDKANALGLTQISFLAADATSDAFARQPPAVSLMSDTLLLDAAEARELEVVIDKALTSHAPLFANGHVAEKGERLRRLATYYQAHQGLGAFPEVRCNAPWASAVIEADGTVRPCFFQPAIGNVRQRSLRTLLNDEMVRFRRGLEVASDPTCQRCTCSLNVGLRSPIT